VRKAIGQRVGSRRCGTKPVTQVVRIKLGDIETENAIRLVRRTAEGTATKIRNSVSTTMHESILSAIKKEVSEAVAQAGVRAVTDKAELEAVKALANAAARAGRLVIRNVKDINQNDPREGVNRAIDKWIDNSWLWARLMIDWNLSEICRGIHCGHLQAVESLLGDFSVCACRHRCDRVLPELALQAIWFSEYWKYGDGQDLSRPRHSMPRREPASIFSPRWYLKPFN
jgi:hypothetical protein